VRPNEAGLSPFLIEVVKQGPAPEEHPDQCSNCGRPHGGTKPLFIALETTTGAGVEQFETALRPAMGYRIDQVAKLTPITSTSKVPADERGKIEAALPKRALARPKKPRKLLVIDLCPAGGYYHATIAHANLAIELMAKNTGACEAVFSNDLNNLKYPAIKQYDGVFLNSVVGEVFPDPAVLGGLLRFVREGGGVAGIHGSTYASMDLAEFSDLMGAADGPHRVEQATLKIDDPDSPLTKQFNGKGFTRSDEYYHFLPTGPYSRDKLHVLISIDASKSDLSNWKVRPDNDYGSVWIKSYGKGRVFNCAMGHTPTLFATPELAQLILNAIQFILGDLPADTTPSAKLSAKK
jgi:type 1 glutamine amidotransferase